MLGRGEFAIALSIPIKRKRSSYKLPLLGALLLTVLTGGYVTLLFAAPAIPSFSMIIDPAVVAQPVIGSNRLIIPKLNVNIEYSPEHRALSRGSAVWRSPGQGDPSSSGTMILAAMRFTLQPTPSQTVRKSPFYRLGSLQRGDKIVIDYNGKRYGYEVTTSLAATSITADIERSTTEPRLTLYSIDSSDFIKKHTVVEAKPLGEVGIAPYQQTN